MKKLCILSLDLERTTRASSLFVCGVAMLLLGLTFALPPLFASTLTAGLPENNVIMPLIAAGIMLACVPAMVLSSVFILAALFPMINAYCIEDGKITKGRLVKIPLEDASIPTERKTDQDAAAANSTLASAALGIAATSDSFSLGIGAANVAAKRDNWFALTAKNSSMPFVETYFYTNCYKRKEYHNPILIKETNKKLIYRCDNKRRLVIPKLYSNMGVTGKYPPLGLVARCKHAVIACFVAGVLAACAMFGVNCYRAETYKTKSMPIVLAQLETRIEMLTPAGYEYAGYDLRKDIIESLNFWHADPDSEKPAATVEYFFGFDGALKSAEFDLYLSPEEFEEGTFAEEFTLLLSTLPDTFAPAQIDVFYQQIALIIDGTYDLTPLISDSGAYTIIVRRANDYYRVKTITD